MTDREMTDREMTDREMTDREMTDREKIASQDYMEILSDYSQPEGLEVPLKDYVFQRIDRDLGIAYVNRKEIAHPSIPYLTYRSIPGIYGLGEERPGGNGTGFDLVPLIRSGVLQVQREPLNLTGRGVVVGFLDTGIRYDEEAFCREDGSTRILGIWDQSINTGKTPEGLLYGSEYTREDINAALRSQNPREVVPSYDENGHGTALVSAAAGSLPPSYGGGKNGGLTGVAPEAEIAVVKLRQAKDYLREFYYIPREAEAYAESDIIAAVKYLEGFALSLVRPLVICMALGSNMGDHGGNSILAGYLNTIATRRSRVVVLGGGDEGNSAHHYAGYAIEGLAQTTDNVEIRVAEGEKGFIAELWGHVPESHAISIKTPGGEVTERVDFRTNQTRDFSFVYEKTRIKVDHVLVEQSSGEELIFFRFTDPTPGIWTIQVTITGGNYRQEGSFHLWLPLKQFLKGDTYFLKPSPYTTITEPGNAREVITTSYYRDSSGAFAAESGRGYSRQGMIKPELATPGTGISSLEGVRSGSAMSAALLTGMCAQFMQWAVVEGNRQWVESRELKNYLIRGAQRDTELDYPNRDWGYGEVNIARCFEVIAGV